MNSRGKDINADAVERIAQWVGDMLRMFGLGEGTPQEIGWGKDVQDSAGELNVCLFLFQKEANSLLTKGTLAQRDEVLMPYLRALSAFRDGVRQLAITKGDGAAKEILALCDRLRDQDLIPLGVALDDQDGACSLWPFHSFVTQC